MKVLNRTRLRESLSGLIGTIVFLTSLIPRKLDEPRRLTNTRRKLTLWCTTAAEGYLHRLEHRRQVDAMTSHYAEVPQYQLNTTESGSCPCTRHGSFSNAFRHSTSAAFPFSYFAGLGGTPLSERLFRGETLSLGAEGVGRRAREHGLNNSDCCAPLSGESVRARRWRPIEEVAKVAGRSERENRPPIRREPRPISRKRLSFSLCQVWETPDKMPIRSNGSDRSQLRYPFLRT